MRKILLTGQISSTDFSKKLGAEVWLNNNCIIDIEHIEQTTQWQTEIPEEPAAEYELRLVMKGKKSEHTQIAPDGTVISDPNVMFTKITVDDLDIDSFVRKLSVYEHNYNGNGEWTTANFAGSMGCNGTVSVKFFTPIYIWYLENR